MSKILVVSSNYYAEPAKKHLDNCLAELDKTKLCYDVEIVEAGSYEIPAVIHHFHKTNAYAGYLTLGLLLKGSSHHYEFIWEHLKECFIQFTLQGILFGDGIIYAPTYEIMMERIENHKRVKEAIGALDYLLKLKNRNC